MPTYGSPGVYVTTSLDALTSSNVGIPGSAIPCFAGAFPQGPLAPTTVTSWGQFVLLYGGFTPSPGNLFPFAVSQFFNNGGSACICLRVPNQDATAAGVILEDINTPPDNILTVDAVSPGSWGNNVYVEVISAGQSGRNTINVYYNGTTQGNVVEQFIDLSMNPSDPRYVESVINSPVSGSNYITVVVNLPDNTYSLGVTDLALISPTPLSTGSNGSVAPVLSTVVPTQLDTIQDQIMNVNLPGVTDIPTLNAMITYAAGRGDTMMVIDGPAPTQGETSADVVSYYQNMVSGSNVLEPEQYATLYSPWLLVSDPSSSVNGAAKWLPPGGAVLGIWNKTDKLVGPWQTPAGTTYGGINAIALEVQFTQQDLTNLEAYQINPIKSVPGSGFCIFGGRTLYPGQPTRYISVSREIIQLTHDFTLLTQFAIFAPNNPSLWSQITTTLTTYLTQQMQLGVFAGTTPDQAFTVQCDSSNNTYASSIAGIVNISVGVALVSPAEFIMINISQLNVSGTSAAS